ncbi:hypothetical protein AYO44_00595 [Planctomycetaceae bacterium SCGC AG-212-F19]|nr:hypothetical protein AYO44_00595 [Planctomycetaceae bacterium SCGC AG-212-F19]
MTSTITLRQIYLLLLVVAAASVTGRLLSANRVVEPYLTRDEANPRDPRGPWPKARPLPSPMFSSNDVSRWATIRALVDEGTYVIGQRTWLDPEHKTYKDTGITFEPGWGGVDKVMDPDTGKFYSSKPTLFPTLLAVEYWLLKNLFGWTLTTHLYTVVRVMLFTVNVIPLFFYWLVLARLVDRFGTTDWGKLFVFAAACFGTFLTTFATSLNNHTIAACTALYALYFGLNVWSSAGPLAGFAWKNCFLAGTFAALTAAVELPALSFLVGLFALLLWKAPRVALIGFAPPVALVVAAGLLTNYLAIGKLTPAYAEFGGKSTWYTYEGSHWKPDPSKPRRGIDFAANHEGRAEYVFHFLLGHHGVFSLSPIWLLSAAGMVVTLRQFLRLRHSRATEPPHATESPPATEPPASEAVNPEAIVESGLVPPASPPPPEEQPKPPDSSTERDRWLVAGLTAYLTVVVVGFYLVISNNYGGNTSGPRWLFWLTPFWLLTMLPVADWLSARRWGRFLALAMLAVSVASVTFPAWNPWRQPWIYHWLDSQGLIPY